ncbi:MAG: ABC transporter family substrate-binding protein [Acidimicrobiales bacterium]
MTRLARRPGLGRRAAWTGLLALALLAAACGDASAPGTAAGGAAGGAGGGADATSTTIPWVVGTGGTLTVGIDRAPTGCNPGTAAGDTWADRLVLAPVLPGAFTVNGKDQPVYDSAVINQAELQSTNPQTVVYTLNPKAVWSDGRPITAADFVYTWQRQRGVQGPLGAATTGGGAPGTPGAAVSAGLLGPAGTDSAVPTTLPGATGTTGTLMGYRQIKSVKPSGHGRTVTVVFTTPYADWQSLFDDLLPAHVMEKVGWDPACTTVDPTVDLSGGPYMISRVVPGHEVVLSKNPRWWEQPPNLDRIVIKTASGPAQLAGWLANGTVQVALPSGFDQQFLERVTGSPSIESQGSPSTTLLQLELSTTSPITSTLAVRQAVAHAVNRQQMVDQVAGWADTSIVPAASHLYSQGQDGYPSPRQLPLQIAGQVGSTTTTLPTTPTPSQPFPVGADLATTDRLLAQAGDLRGIDGTWQLPGGEPFVLRVAVDAGDPWAAEAATILVHQLADAGIGATVTDTPTATAAGAALTSGTADAALLPLHATPYTTTAIAWYTELLGMPGQGGSQDWTGFDGPTLDHLLVKASQQLNPVIAGPLYTQADMLLWEQMVALPLFTEPTVVAWSSAVGGVDPGADGPNLLTTVATWGFRVPPTSPRAKANQPPVDQP